MKTEQQRPPSVAVEEKRRLWEAFKPPPLQHQLPLTRACKLCAKRPLRLTDDCYFRCNEFGNEGLGVGGGTGLSDNGFAELIYSVSNRRAHGDNGDDDYHTFKSVAVDQAQDIVRKGARKVQDFQRQLRQASSACTNREDEFLRVYDENLQAMGLFDWDELRVGSLLGVGGFSNVLQIIGFQQHTTSTSMGTCTSNVSTDTSKAGSGDLRKSKPKQPRPIPHRSYTDKQLVARKFLTKHAIRNNKNPEQTQLNTPNSSGNKDASTAPTSYRYAVKHLRPGLSERYSKRTFHAAAIDLIMEAQFLLALQHPNIIKLRGLAAAGPDGYTDSGHHNGYFLILDLLPETLERRLVSWRLKCKRYKSKTRALVGRVLKGHHGTDVEPKFAALMQQRLHVGYEICSAMEYLHSKRMINRDLKTANIGFDIRGDVKLFDFGLSRLLPPSKLDKETATTMDYLDENFRMSNVGTKMYMAPQVRLQQPYSTKADVFSFGVVLWEIMALADPEWNRPPKRGQEAHGKSAAEKVPLCPCWSPPLQDLVKSVLATEPTERPSFSQLRALFRDNIIVTSNEGDSIALEEVQASRDSGKSDQRGGEHNIGSSSEYSEHLSDNLRRDDDQPEPLGPGSGEPRRRSTFILDFADLSWLSNISASSLRSIDTGNSLRSEDGTPGPASNNDAPPEDVIPSKAAPRTLRRQ